MAINADDKRQHSTTPTLISVALHTVAVLIVMSLAPVASLSPIHRSRFDVTPIEFRAPQATAPAAKPPPQRKAVTELPTVLEGPIAAVHTGAFDRKPQTINEVTNADEVLLGSWRVPNTGSKGLLPDAVPGPTSMYSSVRRGPQQFNTTAERSLDAPARLLSTPLPSYSEEARRLHIVGDVVLEATLSATGTVHVLRVLSGLGHGLDEAAVTAVNNARCRPALRDGHAVDVTATITVVFQLT